MLLEPLVGLCERQVHLLEVEVEPDPLRTVLRICCMMHVFQNSAKKQIADTDKFGPRPAFSSQMMRVSNVWRSFGHHRKLSHATKAVYGKEAANLRMNTTIGKVVKTRWLSLEGPEQKLIRCLLGVTPSLEGNDHPPMLQATAPCGRANSKGLMALVDGGVADVHEFGHHGVCPVDLGIVFGHGLNITKDAKPDDVILSLDLDNLSKVMRAGQPDRHEIC